MKQVPQITAGEAAALVKAGDTVLGGGFGMTGNPVHLLHALAEKGTKNLTFIGNNVGEPGLGGGRLLRNGQIKKYCFIRTLHADVEIIHYATSIFLPLRNKCLSSFGWNGIEQFIFAICFRFI